MYHKKHLLFFGLFCFLFSCNEELKTTFIEANISTKNNKLVEINVPKATENHEVANQINNEINKTIVAALLIGEQNNASSNSVEESITTFNNEYNTFNANFPNVSQPWEAQIDGEVMMQSNEVISIAMTSYVNTGGAHGITQISFLNFEPLTGKRIKNQNLIKNKKAFKDIAIAYFKNALAEEDVIFERNTFKLPENIGFSNDGVILIYNQYEIAPYATGIIEFTIPVEKVADFLDFNGS